MRINGTLFVVFTLLAGLVLNADGRPVPEAKVRVRVHIHPGTPGLRWG